MTNRLPQFQPFWLARLQLPNEPNNLNVCDDVICLFGINSSLIHSAGLGGSYFRRSATGVSDGNAGFHDTGKTISSSGFT